MLIWIFLFPTLIFSFFKPQLVNAVIPLERKLSFTEQSDRAIQFKKTYISIFGEAAWNFYDDRHHNSQFFNDRRYDILNASTFLVAQDIIDGKEIIMSSGLSKLHNKVMRWYLNHRGNHLSDEKLLNVWTNLKESLNDLMEKERLENKMMNFDEIQKNLLDGFLVVVANFNEIPEENLMLVQWSDIPLEARIDILIMYYIVWRSESWSISNGTLNLPFIAMIRYMFRDINALETISIEFDKIWRNNPAEYFKGYSEQFKHDFYNIGYRNPFSDITKITQLLQFFKRS